MFKKDDKGKSYDWRDIEEPQIMKMFEDCKQKMLKIVNEFKSINLPKNLSVLDSNEFHNQDSFEVNNFLTTKLK